MFFWFSFLHILSFVSALPAPSVSNQTDSTVGWVETPQVRGTFDLILACLTTLALCAWTAYHPNVHGSRKFWQQTAHRLLWMTIAVFIPEVVLYCASSQWWEARNLRKDINTLGDAAFYEEGKRDGQFLSRESCIACRRNGENNATSSAASSQYNLTTLFQEDGGSQRSSSLGTREKRKPWTMEQAFFAVSGGYAVDSSSFNPHPRLTFTVPGIRFLAQIGLLPDDPPEVVTDKSKADYAAKILVCLQAGWFFVQCIARLVQRLPLTLLEVHVLAHVLCAFAMYLLWIQKPYDVAAPILCKNEKILDLAALFSLALPEKGSGFTLDACPYNSFITHGQVHNAHAASEPYASHRYYFRGLIDFVGSPVKHEEPPSPPSVPPNEIESAHLERANRALRYLKSRDIHFAYSVQQPTYDPQPHPHAYRLVHPTPFVVSQRSNLQVEGVPGLQILGGEPAATPEDDESYETFCGVAVKTGAALSMLYGALHLAAWSAKFPTIYEQWAWRASGLVFAAMPVIGIPMSYVTDISVKASMTIDRIRWKEEDGEDQVGNEREETSSTHTGTAFRRFLLLFSLYLVWIVSNILGFLVSLPVFTCFLVYPIARVYVLAEAFAQLRAVDSKVYQTVEWSGFVPHIG
ncbi:uncharacterized protein EI97DRAFT_492768 [Westerdykella ornata]|uniref:Uncharacterized protein n=1 Tax=Westerdykella ornata TaxID=318751 RepID=A0A6A6JP02_WESOR|nr:uncharacterized protein EI97DRAFT_492768 [Westerdykella ornata]KAF2278252.1 hypothetical protein EI97DRAFT_492768 [Westerdykella ornata]